MPIMVKNKRRWYRATRQYHLRILAYILLPKFVGIWIVFKTSRLQSAGQFVNIYVLTFAKLLQ